MGGLQLNSGNALDRASDTAEAWPAEIEAETPVMVVDVDRVKRNVGEMVKLCRRHGVDLVPHAKTHRTPEIGRLQLGMGCAGLSVATVAELEGFSRAGATYLVYTSPVLDRRKLERIAAVGKQTRIVVAVDSEAGARVAGAAFAGAGVTAELGLLIDSGNHRDGIDVGEAARLAAVIRTIAGVRLTMVLTHEGHTYRAKDRDDLARLSQASSAKMLRAASMVAERLGHTVGVSMGASAAARLVATTPGVSQLRPGIFAFNDVGQIALGNATADECAARVFATVVSRPSARRAFVDAGSKALGREKMLAPMAAEWPAYGMVVGRPGWRLTALSEEHGWLEWRAEGRPSRLVLGERLQIIPNHVCLAFFGAGTVVALSDGIMQEKWPTIVG